MSARTEEYAALADALEGARNRYLDSFGTDRKDQAKAEMADLLWNDAGTILLALKDVVRQHEERLKLDAKIRKQRRALRENWQIVEQRWQWATGRRYREAYRGLLRRYADLLKTTHPARD